MATAFRSFSEVPVVGETLLVGLNTPVPRCVVRLDVDAQVEGVGVHPDHPPLAWEAWTGIGLGASAWSAPTRRWR